MAIVEVNAQYSLLENDGGISFDGLVVLELFVVPVFVTPSAFLAVDAVIEQKFPHKKLKTLRKCVIAFVELVVLQILSYAVMNLLF